MNPRTPERMQDEAMIWESMAIVSGIAAIAVAVGMYRWVMSRVNENPEMARFSAVIQAGGATYLRRLFQVLAVAASAVIALCVGWRKALAYLVGAACSAGSAYEGM